MDNENKHKLDIQYLGQTGFILHSDGIKIVLDPYLSDYVDRNVTNIRWKRNYPPPCNPQDLADADLVLLSHAHCDHTDPDTVIPLYQAGKMIFLAPYEVISLLKSWGFSESRLIALDDRQCIDFHHISVRAIAAAHEELNYGYKGHIRELSFHLAFKNGITVFFGGDMCLYPGLIEKIPKPVTISLLPINGRSDARNRLDIVGNLTYQEAAELSAQIKANLLIPTHFDLYDINGEDPAVFIAEIASQYPNQMYRIMKPGEHYAYNVSLEGLR